jgi:hypothetical protein
MQRRTEEGYEGGAVGGMRDVRSWESDSRWRTMDQECETVLLLVVFSVNHGVAC